MVEQKWNSLDITERWQSSVRAQAIVTASRQLRPVGSGFKHLGGKSDRNSAVNASTMAP